MKKIFLVFAFSYSLFTCKDDNACEGITCLNDGICKNGQCDCLVNYEGPVCGDQKTPTKMYLTKIVVTKFPETLNDSVEWDVSDGPDMLLYLIEYEGKAYVWDSSPNVIENANPSTDYSFVLTTPVEISPIRAYTFGLFDYDGMNDDMDYMGEFTFTPYSSTNGFLEERGLGGGGEVAFTIGFEYSWD